MTPARIVGTTNVLGPPSDWDEHRDGKCESLSVRKRELPGGIFEWSSAWTPTPAELLTLLKGASVYLTVISGFHPPVLLSVGDVEPNEEGTPAKV